MNDAPKPRCAAVTVAAEGLRVAGRTIPLLAGAVHYWQMEPRHWRRVLEQCAAMGLGVIDTYVPWAVHEIDRASSEYDFGRLDARKNLGAFLDLVGELGLWAMVRPGPHVNAELTYLGLPERIVVDPQIWARSADGDPLYLPSPPRFFAVPSYASEKFHAEVAHWYAAFAEVVRPRLADRGGPVIAVQVDNEGSFYFRDGIFEQDYHPDALALYQARVGGEPPRRFVRYDRAEMAAVLRWAEFQEELLGRGLGRMREALAHEGLDAAVLTHNLPPGEEGSPLSQAQLAGVVDLVGADLYHRLVELGSLRNRSLAQTAMSELPFAAELAAGGTPVLGVFRDRDAEMALLAALGHGVRALTLYMAADRDRWYGAPIASDGTLRPLGQSHARALGALGAAGIFSLRRRAPVRLVRSRLYQRWLRAATDLWSPLGPTAAEALHVAPRLRCSSDRFGCSVPIGVAFRERLARMARALDRAGVPYDWVDGDAPWVGEPPALFCPSYELIDEPLVARLRDAAAHGTRVLVGPESIGPGAGIESVACETDADAERLASRLRTELHVAPLVQAETPGVVTSVLEPPVGSNGAGGRTLVFVYNPTAQAAEVAFDPGVARSSGAPVDLFDRSEVGRRLILPPRTTRVVEVPP